jgi:hypothetical protein
MKGLRANATPFSLPAMARVTDPQAVFVHCRRRVVAGFRLFDDGGLCFNGWHFRQPGECHGR